MATLAMGSNTKIYFDGKEVANVVDAGTITRTEPVGNFVSWVRRSLAAVAADKKSGRDFFMQGVGDAEDKRAPKRWRKFSRIRGPVKPFDAFRQYVEGYMRYQRAGRGEIWGSVRFKADPGVYEKLLAMCWTSGGR